MSNWIKCCDELPENDVEVLCLASDSRVARGIDGREPREIMIGRRRGTKWLHSCFLFYSSLILSDQIIIKHWMPLLKLPPEE